MLHVVNDIHDLVQNIGLGQSQSDWGKGPSLDILLAGAGGILAHERPSEVSRTAQPFPDSHSGICNPRACLVSLPHLCGVLIG